MSEIYLPFLPMFKPKILGHVKTMTCRTRRYGRPGDIFQAFGERFVLTHVFQVILAHVVADAYIQEGCESPEELIAVFDGLYRTTGYQPDRVMWAHCWKEAP